MRRLLGFRRCGEEDRDAVMVLGIGRRVLDAPSTWHLQIDGKRDGLSDVRRCA
jgi:hypothetical protein